MTNEMLERLESALSTGSLEDLIYEMKEKGVSQVEILDIFDQFRDFLSKENREADMDIVMDLMDFIWGWCSPDNAFFEHRLTEEELRDYRESKRQQ